MDPLTYYASQSPITDPGEYVGLFADLPRDIAGLCRVVQGLIIHFQDPDLLEYIPEERIAEVNIRHAENMLARIRELDNRPLAETRPLEKRLVGCCRDTATLFCAMARHQGIPARARIGFSAYFDPDFRGSHEIGECWDADEKRWRLVDPMLSDELVEMYEIQFDTEDIPRDQFLVGGKAWQMCRAGEADPNTFGQVIADGTLLKGLWFIRQKLVQDLAALNKMELLLWDRWGLGSPESQPTDRDLALLDKVAVLTQAGNEAFPEMRAIYENEAGLKVPPIPGPGEVLAAI
jgi:hypothetical protein